MKHEDPGPPYHERQSQLNCGVHCVNNILGCRAFGAHDFQAIEAELGLARWLSFLGNFDINVVMVALKQHGLAVRWLRHGGALTLTPDLLALIVNRRSTSWLPLLGGRHWLALRRVGGHSWWNLDSQLSHPTRFNDEAAVEAFVQHALDKDDGECLMVYKGEG